MSNISLWSIVSSWAKANATFRARYGRKKTNAPKYIVIYGRKMSTFCFRLTEFFQKRVMENRVQKWKAEILRNKIMSFHGSKSNRKMVFCWVENFFRSSVLWNSVFCCIFERLYIVIQILVSKIKFNNFLGYFF